jgi:hypothetical protein
VPPPPFRVTYDAYIYPFRPSGASTLYQLPLVPRILTFVPVLYEDIVLALNDGDERSRSQPPVTYPYCVKASDAAGINVAKSTNARKTDNIRFIADPSVC